MTLKPRRTSEHLRCRAGLPPRRRPVGGSDRRQLLERGPPLLPAPGLQVAVPRGEAAAAERDDPQEREPGVDLDPVTPQEAHQAGAGAAPGLALILMMRFRPEGLWPSSRVKAELHEEPK